MKVKMKLTPEKALELIKLSKGHFFHVVFEKKDGSIRKMTARLNVKKGKLGEVKGTGMSFDPVSKGLLPVYDVNAGFRMLNLNTIYEISLDGDKIVNTEMGDV